MTFGNPRMLWLLAVALPLLALFLWRMWRKRQSLTTQFVKSRLLAHLTAGVSRTVQKLRLVLLFISVGLILFVLAQPQWGFAWEEARQQGLDVIVGIDTSRSMLAEDVKPDRLERAKLAALDLMRLARSDRFGLVAFAGTAFLQCPLTLDEEAFRQSVNALEVGIIPQQGTALAEAIETGIRAFKQDSDNHKILVLFTDGENHEAGALEAAEKAAQANLRIFTIGVGSKEGELLRITDESGQAGYVKDEQGNVVKSRLNETLLTQVASAAHGFYLSLSSANAMEVLHQQGLAPLPRGDLSTKLIKRFREQYQWFLALAIAVLIAEIFLPDRRRVLHPAKEPALPRRAPLGQAAALLALVLHTSSAVAASTGKALQQYEAGKFKEAQQEYERLLETNPNDAKLHYNAGASAYQAGQFPEAIRHFGTALTSPELDLQQRSYYNLGNSLYRLGQKQQDPNTMAQSWEQSIKQFESALKLDPNDPDAQFNLEFVKKKLEELKQQQQQQSQSQSNDPNQDQDQKDQQEQKEQEKSDSSKQDKSEEGPEQKEQEQKQSQAGDPEKPEPEQGNQEKPQNSQKKEEKQDQTGQSATNAAPQNQIEGQMTMEQVKRLLDALKNEEKAMIFVPKEKLKERRISNDW